MSTTMAEPAPSTSTAGSPTSPSLSAETLLTLLECPVCLEPCIPPIYACTIGHKICKTCAPSVRRCPVCRSGYVGTRDFVAEELYTKLSETGILSVGKGDSEDDKEQPIQCHLGLLSETLRMECSIGELTLPTFECYITHLTHRHKVHKAVLQLDVPYMKRFYYRNQSFVRNGPTKLLVLNCCDHRFLLILNKTDDNIWIYVNTVSKKIAQEFDIDLAIPSAEEEGLFVATSTAHLLHSIKEKPEQIYKNKSCFIIKEDNLNNYGCQYIVSGACYWQMRITIRRKSTEVRSPVRQASVSPQNTPSLMAELPHFQDDGEYEDGDGDDLGDQILGLQNQVRDFRIGLINRIRSANRAGPRATPFGSGLSRLSPERVPPGDGSIRNRALLYRSPGTSNLPADSADSSGTTRNLLAIREQSLGRLREHESMVMQLRRLREQREALDRREREREQATSDRGGIGGSGSMDRRALRRTAPAPPTSTSSVITARDFFTDSDEENEYIERLAREAGSPSGDRDTMRPAPVPTPRRVNSASARPTGGLFPLRTTLEAVAAQQRRASSSSPSSPNTTSRIGRGDYPPTPRPQSPDSGCIIS